jgi:hypothetical protein
MMHRNVGALVRRNVAVSRVRERGEVSTSLCPSCGDCAQGAHKHSLSRPFPGNGPLGDVKLDRPVSNETSGRTHSLSPATLAHCEPGKARTGE